MAKIYYHKIINCRCENCDEALTHHQINQKFCAEGFSARTHYCPYCGKLRILVDGEINCPVCNRHIVIVPRRTLVKRCPHCYNVSEKGNLIEEKCEFIHYDDLAKVQQVIREINQ